jgi:predicted RNase H-like nuclease (RuvC/YqgF family)
MAKKVTRTNLQIRGLRKDLHAAVRRRAASRGQTMSQYVIALIEQDRDRSSLEQWLEKLKRLPAVPIRGDMTAAQAVREAREERAEQLAHGFEERWGKRRA